MPERHTIYVCSHCAAVVSFFGRRQDPVPVCYRCHDWPDMEPRRVPVSERMLDSALVPEGPLRELARDMRENRGVLAR